MANTSTSLLQTVKQSLQQGRLDNAKAALEQLFLLNINEHEKAEAEPNAEDLRAQHAVAGRR